MRSLKWNKAVGAAIRAEKPTPLIHLHYRKAALPVTGRGCRGLHDFLNFIHFAVLQFERRVNHYTWELSGLFCQNVFQIFPELIQVAFLVLTLAQYLDFLKEPA
jgi:hypothetical protein